MQTEQTRPASQQPKPRPQAPAIPPEFQAEKIMKLDSAGAVALLKDASTSRFQKSKACMRLAMVGNKDAVPALATLLPNPELSHYARFGLVPIPDPSVDDALRAALKTTKDKVLVGVIDSIGQRRDPISIQPLTTFLYGADQDTAQAAAAAIGLISGPQAITVLTGALVKTKGLVRNAVAAAGLVCAEGLLNKGDRKAALALYNALSRPDMPKPVRLAAMHSTIAVETSLARPRIAPAVAK